MGDSLHSLSNEGHMGIRLFIHNGMFRTKTSLISESWF